MKLAVSYNNHGDIVTLFDPEKLQNRHGVHKYVPAEGEKHHIIDLPKEFEKEPFEALPHLLHVDASGAHPRLRRKS